MLSPYRALDLTDDGGDLVGYTVAQIGAEVIAVEPPTGQHSRRLGPRADGQPDPEASTRHWAHNRGKRSMVIDLIEPEGRTGLRELGIM
ncbi:MAG: hypothetical protein GY929_00580 [Actinomycetia bacterium]|nr:hypothetical protein [Actinomycetes bacterium]